MVLLTSIFFLGISAWLLLARGLKPSAVLLLVYSMYGLTFGLSYQLEFSKIDLEQMTVKAFGRPIFFTSNELWGQQSPPSEVLIILVLLCFSLGMVAFLNRPLSVQKGLKYKITPEHNSKGNVSTSSLSTIVSLGIGLWIWIIIITSHFFSIEWGLLEHFTDYQELKHPEGLGLDTMPLRIGHFLMKLCGPFVLAVGLLHLKSVRLIGLMLIASSLYPFVFNLVTSSRLAVLYPAIITFLSLTRGKRSVFTVSLLSSLVLFTYVLIRRNNPEMGYSTISMSEFYDIFRILHIATIGVFVNIFDFCFQIATASQRPNDWPELYKFLSFSPLPSAIDGFRQIAFNQIRISVYVPYSAWAEAFFFGPVFFTVYLGFVMVLVYLSDRIALFANTRVKYTIIVWILLLNQLMVQYPIRNSFRFILVSIIIFSVIIVLKKRRYRRLQFQKRSFNLRRSS